MLVLFITNIALGVLTVHAAVELYQEQRIAAAAGGVLFAATLVVNAVLCFGMLR
jgi:hypothetical protein